MLCKSSISNGSCMFTLAGIATRCLKVFLLINCHSALCSCMQHNLQYSTSTCSSNTQVPTNRYKTVKDARAYGCIKCVQHLFCTTKDPKCNTKTGILPVHISRGVLSQLVFNIPNHNKWLSLSASLHSHLHLLTPLSRYNPNFQIKRILMLDKSNINI